MNVAVLGASANPQRYSYMAVEKLVAAGHNVFPVHPTAPNILGLKVYPRLSDIPEPVDTVTVYLSALKSSPLEEDMLRIRPRRIIFNPGAENTPLTASLQRNGVETLDACTLVLLSTGQF